MSTTDQRPADARRQICRARSESAEADARRTGEPPADIRHEASTTFVRRQHKLDAIDLTQRVHVVDPTAGGHAEDVADAEIAQGFDELARDCGCDR